MYRKRASPLLYNTVDKYQKMLFALLLVKTIYNNFNKILDLFIDRSTMILLKVLMLK